MYAQKVYFKTIAQQRLNFKNIGVFVLKNVIQAMFWSAAG
jgi:hypothetical protein